ncbi:MAG: helix-turn-helix transcriptional regulator [Sphingorhabdus sp.]
MIEEFIDRLAGLSDVDAVWQATTDLSYAAGFSGAVLVQGQKGPAGTIHAPEIMIDCPDELKTAYTKKGGFGEIDPFLLFLCGSPAAIKLTAKDFPDLPGPPGKFAPFMEYADAVGASNEIGIPVRSYENEIFGGWIFGSNETGEHFDLLAKDHGHDIHFAGILAFERMVALGLGSVAEHNLLSARERECLLWLCAGYRVSKIADKLSISTSAVNLYMTNAKRKLGAKTREQAVARAIFSGQIHL